MSFTFVLLGSALTCVGNLRWVRESTMSRNSWLVGTAGMSFHWVFIALSGVEDCEAHSKSSRISVIDRQNFGPTGLGIGISFCRR
jgi:hypothetical protein